MADQFRLEIEQGEVDHQANLRETLNSRIKLLEPLVEKADDPDKALKLAKTFLLYRSNLRDRKFLLMPIPTAAIGYRQDRSLVFR